MTSASQNDLHEAGLNIIALGDDLPPARFAMQRALRHYGHAPRAIPWLRQNLPNYDAVIVSGLWNYASYAARRSLLGSGVPYVVFPHGMLDPWFRQTYPAKHIGKQISWLANEGTLLKGAHSVLFTSEEERLRSRRSFLPYRLSERVVSYGAVDLMNGSDDCIQSFRATIPELEQRPYILHLGRIHEKKGCDLLIDAFSRLSKSGSSIDLVIAGPDDVGLAKSLRHRSHQLGISERVHWPGMLKGDFKAGAIRGSEALVLPSHQENFGIVVAEALSCGRPALISNKVNIWREVLNDGAGLVADDTASGTFDLLNGFLQLTEIERNAMRTRARSCYERRFNIGQAASDLVTTLTEATTKRDLGKIVV